MPASQPISARSARSPTPQDARDRTEYSCAMSPHARGRAARSGSSRRSGVTTSGLCAYALGPSATISCQPSGRSVGSVKVARPTSRPSTVRGGTGTSAWVTSRRPPPASGSSSIQTSTGSPCVTWTGTCACRPCRTTSTGGSTRRHGMSSTCAMRQLDALRGGRVDAERRRARPAGSPPTHGGSGRGSPSGPGRSRTPPRGAGGRRRESRVVCHTPILPEHHVRIRRTNAPGCVTRASCAARRSLAGP